MKLFFRFLFKNTYTFFINKHYREFLKLMLLYGDNRRNISQKIKFLSFTFEVPDPLSFVWQFKEIFTDEYYRFNTKNPRPVIYDCGANIGTSCLYFKILYPNAVIKAFEADPKIAAILKRNLTANNINDVEIINKAVWVDEQGIELVPDGSDGASIYSEGLKIKVPSLKLQYEILKEPSIDMLKMDIEGAEINVMRDCKDCLSHIKNIFIEYHSFIKHPQELDEVLSILKTNNFRYFISSAVNRPQPLIHREYKNGSIMDLQINIFAYNLSNQ